MHPTLLGHMTDYHESWSFDMLISSVQLFIHICMGTLIQKKCGLITATKERKQGAVFETS